MRPAGPTARATLRRHRERADYERAGIEAVLDEGFICHAACLVDGTVRMIPTAYGRDGDRLLLHGAVANPVLKAAGAGAELTVTVTLVDGLVLARSTFHHSVNYRSVVIYGTAAEITDPAAKERALARIVEHMLPGRTTQARGPNRAELAQTRVVSLPVEEASAKIRSGGPVDDDEDLALPVWAGVLPLRTAVGAPEVDAAHPPAPGAAGPAGAVQPARWLRPGGA